MFLTKSAPAPVASDFVLKFREPFRLPEPGTDAKHDYLVALKPSAPFEYDDVAGITFHKRVYPTDKSLSQNQDKSFDPRYSVFSLTEAQAEAIRKRANATTKRLPARFNRNYKEGCGQPEFLDAEDVVLGDWIILHKLENSGGVDDSMIMFFRDQQELGQAMRPPAQPLDQVDAFKDAMLDAQKPSGKKRI